MMGGRDVRHIEARIAESVLDVRLNTQQQTCFGVVDGISTATVQPLRE